MSANKKEIKLVDFIFFSEGELAFWQWLPLNKDQALKFTRDDFKFCIHIDSKYSESFTIKPDFSKIHHANHWVKALKVEISFLADDALRESLKNMNPPENLVKKLASAYRHLEDSLRDIGRNDIGQYWLSHPKRDHEETDQDVLGGLRLIDPAGKHNKYISKPTIRLKSPIPDKELLITESRWKKLEKSINKNYRTDIALVCLANAEFYCFHGEDYRLALIESIISLEKVIFTYIKQFVPDRHKEVAKKLLSGDSLSEAAKELLPLVSNRLDISSEAINNCLNAINKRHLIVHRTCFRLNPNDTEREIKAVAQIVRKLVPSEFYSNTNNN